MRWVRIIQVELLELVTIWDAGEVQGVFKEPLVLWSMSGNVAIVQIKDMDSQRAQKDSRLMSIPTKHCLVTLGCTSIVTYGAEAGTKS